MKKIQLSEIQNSQILSAKEIQIEIASTPVRYYRHGWQSWSLTSWTDLTTLPLQRPAIFHPLQLDVVHARKSHPHGSWLGAVEFENGSILLLGALATDTTVSLVGTQLSGRSETDRVNWFIAIGEEKVVFEKYAEELGNHFGRIEKDVAPRVWCSWYSLYTIIDEPILFEIFDQLADLPFDVLQVDDGWQVSI
ncbi:MAG TPA: hypothetical protein VFI68_15625, partial [Anaerolineales bacterium]|nr:hypothetical protein [Anaerolineales bacterium]